MQPTYRGNGTPERTGSFSLPRNPLGLELPETCEPSGSRSGRDSEGKGAFPCVRRPGPWERQYVGGGVSPSTRELWNHGISTVRQVPGSA